MRFSLLTLGLFVFAADSLLAADITLPVDTAVTVPVNIMPLTDDTDFKSLETGIDFDEDDLELAWNFVETDGAVSQTPVTPTTSGDYDWTHVGNGYYKIEIPATGAGDVKNDTAGYGWFSGHVPGALPWRGPIIEFVPANVVDSLVAGTDELNVNVAKLNDDATAAANAAEAFDGDATGAPLQITELAVTEGASITTTDENESAAIFVGSGNGHGMMLLSGDNGGAGLYAGSELGGGYGVQVVGGSQNAMLVESVSPAKAGLFVKGGPGTGMGHAVHLQGQGTLGSALRLEASDDGGTANAAGIFVTGYGSQPGLYIRPGATGPGIDVAGGSTSGDGITLSTTSGHGFSIDTGGANMDGLNVDGGTGAGVDIRGDITGSLSGSVGGNVTGTIGGFSTAALADLFDTDSGKEFSDAVAGSVVKEIADHATTPSLTTAGIADAVLNSVLDDPATTGSLSAVVTDIFEFLDGAPTFADAMDEQGYNSERAENLDKLDMPVSEVRAQSPNLLVSTSIDDTTPTQTSFDLANGPTDDDALNGALVIVTRGAKKSVGFVKDYEGSTKTITLLTDPGIFTFADEDQVDVIATGTAVPLWLVP